MRLTLIIAMMDLYPRRRKALPVKSLILSLAAALLLYWFGGVPGWGATTFAVVQFLLMGGLRFFKLLYKTLPRDLRFMMSGIKMRLALNRKISENKMTVDYLTETASKYPNKVAIHVIGIDGEPDRTLTFRELERYVNKVANYFKGCGLKKGDSVALFLENSPESLALYLGLAKIGVISALININLRRESLLHCIKVSECVGVVFSASLSDAISTVLQELEPAIKDNCYSVCGESSVPEAKSLEDELKNASSEPPPPVKDTSVNGTTGLPKACKVADTKLFMSASVFEHAGRISVKDSVYCSIPLYHSHGVYHSVAPMIYSGCTLVIRNKFSASHFWTDCVKYNCTIVYTIGEICRYLLAQPVRPSDTNHKVRLTVSLGLRGQIWKLYQDRFKMTDIIEVYGATESNCGFCNISGKPGAVGSMSLFFPYIVNVHFIKIDSETGVYVRDENGFCVDCGVNEPGESICEITKKSPFFGYRNKEGSKKKVLCDVFKKGDSYFRSGDVMRMDEEGWVYFCDRSGDTFRWKGENVSTAEVESIMSKILELTDVVVYGVEVPGNEGRAGMAAIVGSPESIDPPGLPQQLFLSLPAYAVPLFVRFIKSADLTGTFKLQKVKLRNQGFDITKVSDPLYMMRGKSYVPLTDELYQEVLGGNIKL